MTRFITILFLIFFAKRSIAQVADYRDAFLGLYHTATPPCVSGIDPPNHFVLIEKDTQSATGIIVTDTMWGDASPPNFYGYRHPCNLIQSDSTYMDGFQLGKFYPTDSLKITGNICGFGTSYFLRKITPIGLFAVNNITKEWYLFPNPAVNKLNIVLRDVNEELTLRMFDISGKELITKSFKGSAQLDVSSLPKGVYFVRIQGKDINLSKRVVLLE